MKQLYFSVIYVLTLAGIYTATPVVADEKAVIGWVEKVHVVEANITFEAKIDTGADYSSIKAEVLEILEEDDEEWVRFSIENRNGEQAVLKSKLVRYAMIKSRTGSRVKRPVVRLNLCLGNVQRDVEVNLAARKNFKYHLLIGRDFLKGIYLVDSSIKNSVQPSCKD